MASSTIVFVTTPEDETIIASKGTLAKQFTLTQSLGFMCLVFTLRETTKMRYLPFWRSRIVESWEDNREKALEAFEQIVK